MAATEKCKKSFKEQYKELCDQNPEALDKLLFYRAIPATCARSIVAILMVILKIDRLCPEGLKELEADDIDQIPSFLTEYVWSARFVTIVLRILLIIACFKKP